MELIDQAQEQAVARAPDGILRVAARGRGDLGGLEADSLGEERDVHAPFVLAARPRGGAQDHDLALAARERAAVK